MRLLLNDGARQAQFGCRLKNEFFPHDQIKKEAEERDAMTRMSELYTKNPNLGDAAPLVHRLAENQKNLDGLQVELTKFQVFGIAESQPGLRLTRLIN